MKALTLAATAALLGAFAPTAMADGRQPGSVLIFPVHRSGGDLNAFFSIVCVTNTNTLPATQISLGGSTNLHYQYVNVQAGAMFNMPAGCSIFNRHEMLTPADTFCVLTSCHNAFAPGGQEGYLVVAAEDPTRSPGSGAWWSHNDLIGSELVLSASGVSYQLNAFASRSPLARGLHTDEINPGGGAANDGNQNGQLDFDGTEYETLPDILMSDFVAAAGSQLALLNLTGNQFAKNAVQFVVYNDNENALSQTVVFNCWFDAPLATVAPLFSEAFLQGTMNDPNELDIDCGAGNATLETGWFTVESQGVTLSAGGASISGDGAILGSITSGPASVQGGHLLWEQGRQSNGAFRAP